MKRSVARLGALMAVVAAAFAITLAPGSPAAASVPTLPAPNSHGITTTGWAEVTANQPTDQPRLFDLTLTTGQIYRPGVNPTEGTVPIHVRILLPANYSTDTSHPYDTLYLLHGGAGTYVDWADSGDVKNTVANSAFHGIVVMPDAGLAGWYTDWYGQTDGRFSPGWETFHINQLLPWIDANFNTKANRAGRAIAGVSMGGWGALHYAAAHSNLFSKLGVFSGGTDITQAGAQQIVSDSMWQAGASTSFTGNWWDGTTRVNLYNGPFIETDQAKQMAYRLQTVFGPAGGWSALNPVDIALTGAYDGYSGKLAMYAGGNPSGETGIGEVNNTLHARLKTRGVTHRYCAGSGDHTWQYFKEDLKDFLAYAYGTPITCVNGYTLQP
jgi:S-formylglutathione hydrolase FrmB